MSVMNVSNMVGAVLSGWLFDRIGASGMFYTLGGLSMCALLLFVVGVRSRATAGNLVWRRLLSVGRRSLPRRLTVGGKGYRGTAQDGRGIASRESISDLRMKGEA